MSIKNDRDVNTNPLRDWALNVDVEISPNAPTSIRVLKEEARSHHNLSDVSEVGRGAICACFRHKYTNYDNIVRNLDTKADKLKSRREIRRTTKKTFGRDRKVKARTVNNYTPLNVRVLRSEAFQIIRRKFDSAIEFHLEASTKIIEVKARTGTMVQTK